MSAGSAPASAGQKSERLIAAEGLPPVTRAPSPARVARAAANIHWVRPELVAEIEFAGWTAAGMVRQAAFKGLREDKPAAEVEAESPAPAATTEVAASPVKTATTWPKKTHPARAASSLGATPSAVMGVPISRPDKVMWPEAGGDGTPVTKLDLARYYEAVGSWMIRHLKGRPCSIIRAPDGLGGGPSSSAMPCRVPPTCWSL